MCRGSRRAKSPHGAVREGNGVNGDSIRKFEADTYVSMEILPALLEMAKVLRQQLDKESVAVTPLSQLV